MTKTKILSGEELKVEGLEGFNASVHNLGDSLVYASNRPNIVPGNDGVLEIPSGGAKLVSTPKGKLYLLGTGKVELTGQDNDGVDYFSTAPAVYAEGGASDVTKGYVDGQDAVNLNTAKGYTDEKIDAVNNSITALQNEKADKTELPEILDAANAYTDNQVSKVKVGITDLQIQKADRAELSEALNSANERINSVDADIAGLQNAKADKTEIPIVSNPNLIINSDFNIWQRYPTKVYEGIPANGIYIADRFLFNCSRAEVTKITAAEGGRGVKIVSGSPCRIMYRLEGASAYNGKKMTLSIIRNGVLSSETFTPTNWDDSSDIFLSRPSGQLLLDVGETVSRVKLEVGDRSTLANDPFPDPATELLKCQRYYYTGYWDGVLSGVYSYIGQYLAVNITFPVCMYKTPAVKMYASSNKTDENRFANPAGSGLIAADVYSISAVDVSSKGIRYLRGSTKDSSRLNNLWGFFFYEANAEL